jgi:hypothetical protein
MRASLLSIATKAAASTSLEIEIRFGRLRSSVSARMAQS